MTQGNIQVHPDSLSDVSATRTLLTQQAENNQRRRNRTQSANDENIQCPICLLEAELPIEVIKADKHK